MALMDEFKESREKIKNATPKEKFNYYWYYYKFHVLITAGLLFLLGSFIYSNLTRLDTVFTATLINVSAIDIGDTSLSDSFATLLEVNTNEEKVVLDDTLYIDVNNPSDEGSYYSLEKLSVLFSTYATDVTIMTENLHRPYAYGSIYYDLREILSEEQLTYYEPYFYYIDFADYEEISQAQLTDSGYTGEYKDPYQPELMQDPIPVGICISEASTLTQYYYIDATSVLGIPLGCPNLDSALLFIDYIFNHTS